MLCIYPLYLHRLRCDMYVIKYENTNANGLRSHPLHFCVDTVIIVLVFI